ncbi:MAG: outer-membrane lipoprotein carrier protein LolA [Dysgonamonadaceae bacterium]|jgi:outer membrane lipoprotein-sorting protein|nr:outer-membrane lipoprotein carrier protein LolA [Dysgonamonadaceae bacterium]
MEEVLKLHKRHWNEAGLPFILHSLVFIFLCFSPCFAQKDANAGKLLDKSAETFARAGGISASFTLNIKNTGAKTAESFDGSILMKGDKFFLSTPETDSWFDGKTQWVYMKNSKEVNISEPTQQELQMMTPSVLFNVYKKGFNYKYTGERTDLKGYPVYELELIPRKKTGVTKVIIQIGKKDNLPVSISIINKNGINNIIHINKYQTGQNFSDDLFVFNKKKYPEVEIIDLR